MAFLQILVLNGFLCTRQPHGNLPELLERRQEVLVEHAVPRSPLQVDPRPSGCEQLGPLEQNHLSNSVRGRVVAFNEPTLFADRLSTVQPIECTRDPVRVGAASGGLSASPLFASARSGGARGADSVDLTGTDDAVDGLKPREDLAEPGGDDLVRADVFACRHGIRPSISGFSCGLGLHALARPLAAPKQGAQRSAPAALTEHFRGMVIFGVAR